MLGPLTTIIIFCSYMALLFMVALYVERQARVKGKNLANNPIVYSLSLAVYCTSWTFYGSVGKAVTSGPLFLAIYLGPTLCVVLWWTVLRKLVRIKSRHRITSIADFISARYLRHWQPWQLLEHWWALCPMLPCNSNQLSPPFP